MKTFEASLAPSMWEVILKMLKEQGADIDRVIILSDDNIEQDRVAIMMSPENIQRLKDGVSERFVLFKDDKKLEPSGAV